MCMSEKRKPLKPVKDCVGMGGVGVAAMHDNHFLYGLYNLKENSCLKIDFCVDMYVKFFTYMEREKIMFCFPFPIQLHLI